MNVNAISILLLVQQQIAREGLEAVLRSSEGVTLVGSAGTVGAALQMAIDLQPRIAVVQLSLPLCAVDAARRILSGSPSTRVLVLSHFAESSEVGTLLCDELRRAGAVGLLPEEVSATALIEAVHALAEGKTVYREPPPAKLLVNGHATLAQPGDSKHVPLTYRQTQVLKLIAEGLANKEIAERLGISPKTVEKHRQSVKDKLHTHNAADLTRRAIGMGLVQPV